MSYRYSLKTTQEALLKAKPIAANQLADSEKSPLPAPKTYTVHSFSFDRATNHLRVAFLLDSFKGRNTWFIEVGSVQLFDQGKLINFSSPTPTSPLQTFDLRIPYFSQLDNLYNPTGSCNVTSIAMCLHYLGLRSKNPKTQLEDELYQYCIDKGLSRHSPIDLAKVVKDYGFKDDFKANAKWTEVKAWLLKGNPIVVHGYFTNFGHIVVIRGFNQRGWIVNDPYGEWWASGYDTNASGERLTYSYKMMDEICGAKVNDLWIHFISK